MTDEEKLMFKRLICWYKELKTRILTFNAPPDQISNDSEM